MAIYGNIWEYMAYVAIADELASSLTFVDFYFWCTLYIGSREISPEKTSPTAGTKNHLRKVLPCEQTPLETLTRLKILKLKFFWGGFYIEGYLVMLREC